jgi:transcription antitermination factor NusG
MYAVDTRGVPPWVHPRRRDGRTAASGGKALRGSATDTELRNCARETGVQTAVVDDQIHPGDAVKIVNGPLSAFDGEVIDVNRAERKLRVRVHVSDREIPVELDLDQVIKVD